MFQNRSLIFKLIKINPRVAKASYATETVFKVVEAKLHRLTEGPNVDIPVTKDMALKWYRDMYTVRRIENTLGSLYKAKFVRGFCHLYVGQEAIPIGIKSAMTGKDTVITSYRCHGWTYIMGVSALGVIAELTGRETGIARGRGGSMHLYADNFYGGNGIVGAQVPLGTGLALKHKYVNDGGFCITLYGDGAANQGQVCEAFNIACLQKLPVLFAIENNVYGMGTSSHRSSSNTAYYTRGDVIPGILVDGMCPISVRAGTLFAREYITSGKGPLLMELDTYRYFGHSMSDADAVYRSRDEIEKVRKTRDPIAKFKEKIISAGLVTEDELKKIDNDVRKQVADAEAKAKTDKEVSTKDLFSDVYAINLEGKIRGTTVDTYGDHSRFGAAVNMK